jgi:hypothetical protein
MNTATLDHIKSFTIEQLWSLPLPLTEHTALAHDFGIAGHDGKEFMEAYALRFGVALGVFDWLEYFGPEEGGNPFGLVSYLFHRFVRGVPARKLLGLPEISLGHLVLCANLGKWQPPS